MTRAHALAAVLCLAAVATPRASDGGGAAAFERIRSLAGRWEGTAEWTGARTGSYKLAVTYYPTGNGSAMIEDMGEPGAPAMTSVYHLDGADLRVTHYCGAQNQPRLKADRIDMARGEIDFAFVDITNLRAPDAPHVHGAELRFVDADHVVLTFIFNADGKVSRETITLARAGGGGHTQP